MNIVLLDPRQTQAALWSITSKRQLEHLQQHVKIQVGDTLKVGIRGGKRYCCEVISVAEQAIQLKALYEENVPKKITGDFNCGDATSESATPFNHG